MHYNNCDIVILMHKRNNKRRCWNSYGTPGAGVDFLNTHTEVSELWEEYIYNYEGNKIVFNFCGYNTDTVHIARRSQAVTEGTYCTSIHIS